MRGPGNPRGRGGLTCVRMKGCSHVHRAAVLGPRLSNALTALQAELRSSNTTTALLSPHTRTDSMGPNMASSWTVDCRLAVAFRVQSHLARAKGGP